MNRFQSGGPRRHWLFDPAAVESITEISDQLVYEDVYFAHEQVDTVVTKVLDTLMAELEPEEREAINLVYITGLSQRAAGRELHVDHKTVASRCRRGIRKMRARLVDSVWIADMLAGAVPNEELPARRLDSVTKASQIVSGFRTL